MLYSICQSLTAYFKDNIFDLSEKIGKALLGWILKKLLFFFLILIFFNAFEIAAFHAGIFLHVTW